MIGRQPIIILVPELASIRYRYLDMYYCPGPGGTPRFCLRGMNVSSVSADNRSNQVL